MLTILLRHAACALMRYPALLVGADELADLKQTIDAQRNKGSFRK